MTLIWDPADYHPADYDPRLMRASEATPPTRSGRRKITAAPGGYWMVSFGRIPLNTPERVRRWRAFVAQADGGATEFEVRLPERLYNPWPMVGGRRVFTPGGIAVTLNGAFALNATSLSLTKTSGEAIEGGMGFSLTGPRWGKRYYSIATASDAGGGNWDVTIRTGLREAFATATACDFETPGFIATVANAADLGAGLENLKRGVGGVSFMESFRL